jgi:hypothetical protein
MATASALRHSPPIRNRLLRALLPTDLALLRPHLKPVVLPLYKDIERPNRLIEIVVFMEAGIASVVAVQSDDTKVEVGLIGCEGMSGTTVVLAATNRRIQPTCRSPVHHRGPARE